MNLIAKEFIAAKADRKGVLVLSEMAGAAKELGEAFIVNPNNQEKVVEVLHEALSIGDEEKLERNEIMRTRLKRYNLTRWANDFIDRLSHIKKLQKELSAKKLTDKIKKELRNEYLKSKERLILLDYDGTLMPIAEKPEKVKPDEEVMKLLDALSQEGKNEVVVVSGRNKKTLEKWFSSLKVGLIAEHGVWFKEGGGSWEIIEPLRNDWKKEILPILEQYTDRTPGSFIEEKEYSVAWHYRKADPELGSARATELKDALLHLTTNFNLGILEGKKVVEIRNIGINKGRTAIKWISKKRWGFIIAIGDDWTDEDVFAILPKSAYSIKVGLGPSQARFNLDQAMKVRALLKELAEIDACAV